MTTRISKTTTTTISTANTNPSRLPSLAFDRETVHAMDLPRETGPGFVPLPVNRTMTQDLASLWTLLETHWREASLLALSLTGPREKSSDLPRRFDVRPVTIAGQLLLQWTATDARKRQTHQNLNWQDSLGKLHALFGPQFSSAHLKTAREDVQIRLLDSGRLQLKHTSRNSAPHAVSANTSDMASHNQSRGYLLPEGRPIPFLKATGIMTETGQVRQAMYRKFRQINRFVEFVFDLRDRFPRDRPVRIVDYGCGKSYLTFAVRHLLVETLGLRVDMLGLDSNPDVIAACLKTREQLGWTDLDFQVNSIAQAEMQPPIDLALWLHACDTATDQAIARSVQLEAELILAVPCCQHELHHQLQNEMLAPLLAHGILRERLAALCTDALRAQLLEAHGYRTQVMEFIDLEHTAKNLLLRACRGQQSITQRTEAWNKYLALKQGLQISHFALEHLLGNPFDGTASPTRE